METCWMKPPFGQGEPKEFEATPSTIVPLMVAGWSQCPPPEHAEEVNENVNH